jgi:hypothetical protein
MDVMNGLARVVMAEGSVHFTAVLNLGGGDLILKRIAQRDLS